MTLLALREAQLAWLRDAMASARGVPGWHVFRLPWPMPAALPVLSVGRPPAVVFAPADGDTLIGYGEACALVEDDERHGLARIRDRADQHYATTSVHAHPDLPVASRRPVPWIGGMRFQPEATADPVWRDFPAAAFAIPRWTMQAGPLGASLALTVDGASLGDEAVTQIEREFTTLGAGPPRLHRAGGTGPARTSSDEPAWLDAVAAALAEIDAGRFEKLVLARHVDVARSAGLDSLQVLENLQRRFPACALFYLARAGSEFFGATPEMLVRLRDGLVESEAVAGSAGIGQASRLVVSPKEQHEHALVVDAIVRALGPACESIDRPAEPIAHRLANIVHLRTPIRGRLREPVHVLSLVERLHPTPAVGGTPTAAALAYLRAAEGAPRGWYAAPFGRFDERGEGHFVVALRSCVRYPGGLRAYAGAGIVRGSRPLDELEETRLKLRAVLDALDVIADEPASRVG